MSHCTLCLEFIHAMSMHCLLLTNLLILDLDSQHSRRSTAFAALPSLLHQPFVSLWIYFMDINKVDSGVLLNVINIGGGKSNRHRSIGSGRKKPLAELSGILCVFVPNLWLTELMAITPIMMEREARFSMFIRINEHLPQRNGQYFFVLTC